MTHHRFAHRFAVAALALALAPAAGCQFYFGGGGDDECDYPAEGLAYYEELRDPWSGTCQVFGGGGGGGCDVGPTYDRAPAPDWASCQSGCEGLAEADCAAAEYCRGAYYEDCPACDDLSPPTFLECWGVAPSGPLPPDVACDALDAYGCSQRNDCQAVYAGGLWRDAQAPEAPGLEFLYCRAEVGVPCGDTTCAPGETCEVVYPPCEGDDCDGGGIYQCVPQTSGVCDEVLCGPGTECIEVCDGGGWGGPEGDALPPLCYPSCEPVGVCPPGHHIEERCEVGCDGADPSFCVETCSRECVPDGGDVCDDGQACPPGSTCSTTCLPCAPDAPWGEMCGCVTTCEPIFPGCAAALCAPGTHCEETCHPCDPLPDGSGCEAACEIACVPDAGDPGRCDGEVVCEVPPPACPTGTTPGISGLCWSGYCIPLAACGPSDPGECGGVVTCGQPGPACPDGTVAGVRDGCYTGYCLPDWTCAPGPTCDGLATEEACISAAGDLGCWPSYAGTDCTCDASGACTCNELTFARCNAPVT
ncbi:MAG: hypothetical protein R2939_21335 [Kofleriaceae bacterium]